MMYTMVCRQFRKEEERFWFCQERVLIMPASEEQTVRVKEVLHKDT